MGLSENNDLMDVVRQTAFNVSGISEQMGVVVSKINAMDVKQRQMEERLASGLEQVNTRMQSYEDRIRLTRPQARNVQASIHARVKELLNIRYEDGVVAEECLYADKYYRPGFLSRLYADARRDSRLGTPYSETYQKDLEEVLDYINRWLPPRGIEGYKRYLDARREK